MKKGFTITEMLAVIAIIAILSIAAMSGYYDSGCQASQNSINTHWPNK
jgi:prepilin-type N-terminal cleavage/methylation domain-containing protein